MRLQNNYKYSACIFDLDGTLTNTLEDLKNSVNYALQSEGLPLRSKEEIRRFVGNGVLRLIGRSVPENTPKDVELKVLETYRKHYAVHLNDTTAPYDGIMQMLRQLQSDNIKTAVVSNKGDEAVKSIVKGFFSDIIPLAIGRKDDVPAKPAPDSVWSAMKELGCSAKETIYIGDSEVDVETAHNAGLKCIAVSWGFRDKELLQSVGADYIIDTPKEIFNIIK
ncbi:MAG: HAD-IA family hydrolase [Clostridia bacterium]|nr:HAD-IA family hydrolase [Clostridia bacterium]